MDRSSSWYEDSEETEQRRTIMNYHSGGAADGALFAPLLENEASTYFNEPILGSVSPIETSAFGNQYQLWETGLTERVLQPVDSSHLATPRSMHMQQSMGIFDRTQEVLQVVGATYNDYTTDQRSVGLVLRGSSTIAPRDMHLGGHERLFTAPTRSTTDGMHMEEYVALVRGHSIHLMLTLPVVYTTEL